MVTKEIEGYEGKYAVTDTGLVFSIRRNIYLKPHKSNCGYVRVQLCGHDHKSVHRLVAETFISKIVGKNYVNHKDGNKFNNNKTNLEWVTSSENAKHAYKSGLKTPSGGITRGEDNKLSVLTEKQVKSIVKDSIKLTYTELSEKYKVSIGSIKHVLMGRTWKHITGGINNIPKKVNRRILVTEDDVRAIRKLFRDGVSSANLSRKYKISRNAMNKITSGRTWKNI